MHRKLWKGLAGKQMSLFQVTTGYKVSHGNGQCTYCISHDAEYLLNLSASIAVLANLFITNYCSTWSMVFSNCVTDLCSWFLISSQILQYS
jgi:hypothetical protein